MVTVLASLFSGRLVRSDVAMTGEITLRGLVLPVRQLHILSSTPDCMCCSRNRMKRMGVPIQVNDGIMGLTGDHCKYIHRRKVGR